MVYGEQELIPHPVYLVIYPLTLKMMASVECKSVVTVLYICRTDSTLISVLSVLIL